jgi:hypothetical protein
MNAALLGDHGRPRARERRAVRHKGERTAPALIDVLDHASDHGIVFIPRGREPIELCAVRAVPAETAQPAYRRGRSRRCESACDRAPRGLGPVGRGA